MKQQPATPRKSAARHFPNRASRARALLQALLPLATPCIWSAAESAAAAEPAQTSLHADVRVRELGWIADFTYAHRLVEAQRAQCVAYSMEMKAQHVRDLRARQLPWVQPTASADADFVVGWSHGWADGPAIPPQPIFGYLITDPDRTGPKLRVVLVGGNHAREHPGCWALHGLIEFLVSDDPQARALRAAVAFYVYPTVNPDGKWHLASPAHAGLMPVNGNPELHAAGESNHNRVWHTSGRFTSIDTVKRAWHADAGARPDYLLDFHGIPQYTFAFAREKSAGTPLAKALVHRRINLRRGGDEPGILAVWAMAENGLDAAGAFTPEIANADLPTLLATGRQFALALHDVVSGRLHEPWAARFADVAPAKPPLPAAAWLLDGDARAAVGGLHGDPVAVAWSADTPFALPGNRAADLQTAAAHIDFGRPDALSAAGARSAAMWVKGAGGDAANAYLFSQYDPRGEARSWALLRHGASGEMLVELSADGSLDGNRSKRVLSHLWPVEEVFTDQWRHLAFVYQSGGSGTVDVYVDGRRLPMGAGGHAFAVGAVPALHATAAPLRIGALAGADNAYTGLIDEVAVWDCALSAEHIRWLSGNSLHRLLDPAAPAGEPLAGSAATAAAAAPVTLQVGPRSFTTSKCTAQGTPVVPMWQAPLPTADHAAGYPLLAAAEHAYVWQPASLDAGAFNHFAALAQHHGRLFAMWSNHPGGECWPGQRVLYAWSDAWGEWSEARELFPAPGPIKGRGEPGIHLKADRWVVADGTLYAVAYADRVGRYPIARAVAADGTLGEPFIARVLPAGRGLAAPMRAWEPGAAPLAELAAELGAWYAANDAQSWWVYWGPGGPSAPVRPLPPGEELPVFMRNYRHTPERAQWAAQVQAGYHRSAQVSWWVNWGEGAPSTAVDGGDMIESFTYRARDGGYVLMMRSWGHSRNPVHNNRMYVSFSDSLDQWPALHPTDIPDSPSRAEAVTLADGTVLLIGNQIAHTFDTALYLDRDPLTVAVSADGLVFDRVFALRADAPRQFRFAGIGGRNLGFGYSSSLVHDGWLYTLYSIGKEDMAITRVPIGEWLMAND